MSEKNDLPMSTYKSPNNRPGSVHMSMEDTYKHTIAELEKEKHYYMDKYVAVQKELDELKKKFKIIEKSPLQSLKSVI